MATAMVVGNGFNLLLKGIINSSIEDHAIWVLKPCPSFVKEKEKKEKEKKEKVVKEIEEISRLWSEYDTIFKMVKDNSNQKLNDEEVIRLIHTSLDVFSVLDIFKKILTKDQIKEMKSIFEILMWDKIKDVSKKFMNLHEKNFYSEISIMFPNFGKKFDEILSNKKDNPIHIYTTNYDGILDTLLIKDYRFNFVDGFGEDGDIDFLSIDAPKINESPKLLAHIHGSYLYEKQNNISKKQRRCTLNNHPIIVFDNPDTKKFIIKNDNILSAYYKQLRDDLSSFDKLIIFGNSMQNEPHLKEIIKAHFDKEGNQLIICSYDEESIEKVKEQLKGSFSQLIIGRTTKDIKTESQLLALFKEII